MALGKRKRETQVVARSKVHHDTPQNATSTVPDTNEIFRKYFEAQFAPLPLQCKSHEEHTNEYDSEDEEEEEDEDKYEDSDLESPDESNTSEWSGISEHTKSDPVTVVEVKVIDHRTNTAQIEREDHFHRARQKAFMSTKPPRDINDVNTTGRNTTATQSLQSKEELQNDQLNLQNDLALQRLLRESHLLEKSKTSSTPGKERQRALDMRLQSLGAKESIFTQRSMPVGHRVGITRKAEGRERKRRQEAKEGGVVLERVAFGGKKGGSGSGSGKRRERGVDAPGVGRFSGGTLKLSRRDVASIQGPSSGSAVGKSGRRRR